MVTPGPSRCTVPASGPPMTRSSATPPGSASEVAADGALEGGDHGPVPQRAGGRRVRGDLLPADPEHGPAPGQPGTRRDAAPRVHDHRGQVFLRARTPPGAPRRPARRSAPSSPLTITSAGPCGVRAVSAIRIRLLQCYPGTPAPRAPLGRAGSCSCSAASAAMLSNFTSRLPAVSLSPPHRPAPHPPVLALASPAQGRPRRPASTARRAAGGTHPGRAGLPAPGTRRMRPTRAISDITALQCRRVTSNRET